MRISTLSAYNIGMNNGIKSDVSILQSSKLKFYYYTGDPSGNPMIKIIADLYCKRYSKRLNKPTLRLIYSYLLTGKKLHEAFEFAKINTTSTGTIERIAMYIPSSPRYYIENADRSVGFMVPNIEGVGLERTNKAISFIGQSFDRTSFGRGGLGFYEVVQGSKYETREGGKFRTATFRDPKKWPIWDILESEEDMFALWSGFQSLGVPINSNTQELYQSFRMKHRAVIADKSRNFMGEQVNEPAKNYQPYLSPAPELLQKQVKVINQQFPKELSHYRYIRTFRDDIYHGGRLNSILTRMPKRIRMNRPGFTGAYFI